MMQQDIRRKDRALSEADAREIMAKAEHGSLATVGPDGWPYSVIVNHVLDGNFLYFHGAAMGHKLRNIAHEARVSFSAVSHSEVLPQELTTRYESAILFGRAEVVEDPGEKRRALELLGQRFCADFRPEVMEAVRKDAARTAVVRIRIERITGKANR
jgi:nitroimidazol reductase NimA-like FMN-containing flavoprotein (pyridoxamine 5'-phosphate oxidase superfamily)